MLGVASFSKVTTLMPCRRSSERQAEPIERDAQANLGAVLRASGNPVRPKRRSHARRGRPGLVAA